MTLANRIVLLDQINSQPPSTTHGWLAEVTGVSKFAITHYTAARKTARGMGIMQRKMGNISNQKHEGKDPDTEGSLNL